MSQYFPKLHEYYSQNLKFGLDQSNYAKKDRFKKSNRCSYIFLAVKSDLASLKAEVDKIDIDKLKTVPANLCKLRRVADNEIVKKTVNEKLPLRLMPLILVDLF